MKSILAISALLLSYASCVKAAGGFTCQTPQKQPGSMAKLAYCVYDPVDSAPSSGWPTIISLPGSGARGPPSNAKTLAGYDAVGKLVAQYLSGQKDASHTMAATKFLTIVPIAPDGSRHFDPDNVLAILDEVKSNYKVDSTRVYVTGFSMGSRGCWRFGTAHPDVVAAMACSAGGAEKAGDGTLTQEPAPPVFPLLKNIISIPSRQFAGSSDTTAGTESPKATENQLQSLGAKNANLDIMNTDHMGLSTKPWTDTDLLSWFLQQSQSGSSSAPAASNSTSSSPSKSKPSPVAKNLEWSRSLAQLNQTIQPWTMRTKIATRLRQQMMMKRIARMMVRPLQSKRQTMRIAKKTLLMAVQMKRTAKRTIQLLLMLHQSTRVDRFLSFRRVTNDPFTSHTRGEQ